MRPDSTAHRKMLVSAVWLAMKVITEGTKPDAEPVWHEPCYRRASGLPQDPCPWQPGITECERYRRLIPPWANKKGNPTIVTETAHLKLDFGPNSCASVSTRVRNKGLI